MSPSFQTVGKQAYHPGLQTMKDFDDLMGHPHTSYKIIHVAGTNGKGSVSSMLAAVLSGLGYKVGLYTSPHLTDFRERVKILLPAGNNSAVSGNAFYCVPKEDVVEFWEDYGEFIAERRPSFFEITTALAFRTFAKEKVDFAVVETGLGGRLDSTNIVTPVMSVITSIGLDHCDILGDTLEKIAYEKAGIIKEDVPVVTGSMDISAENVIREVAMSRDSELFRSEDLNEIYMNAAGFSFREMDLKGEYQQINVRTVLACLFELYKENVVRAVSSSIYYTTKLPFSDLVAMIKPYIYSAGRMTGFHGRWEKLSDKPVVFADIAHNPQGICATMSQLMSVTGLMWTVPWDVADPDSGRLYMIFGVVADKDLQSIMDYLPRTAYYFWTNPKGSRALPSGRLAEIMKANRFPYGEVCESVEDAVMKMKRMCGEKDIVYIGGSSYVVAEALPLFQED